MLKAVLTIASVLVLDASVQLSAADAQSAPPSSDQHGSPHGGGQARATMGLFGSPGSPAPGGKGTMQQRPTNPQGFVCCVSPEGSGMGPE